MCVYLYVYITGIKKFVKKDVESKTHKNTIVICGQRVNTCLSSTISTIDLVNYLALLL